MITTPLWVRHLRKAVKARWRQVHGLYVRRFRSYGAAEFLQALRRVGVREGDTLMLHSAYSRQHGFRGTVEELTQVLIDALGPQGHLLMVSMAYHSSSLQYLERLKRFDVRSTPSMMGLVSEYFRRRPEVRRSAHPTHPILVRGPRATEFIAGHERCLYGCGPGSPFERLLEADGLVAFLNVSFGTFTFFHHLEHLVSHELPFALYTEKAFEVPVIDQDGRELTVRTHPFALEAIRRRRPWVLEQALRQRGAIVRVQVGATTIEAVRARAAVACARELAQRGIYFHDTSPAAPAPRPHPIEGDEHAN